MTQLLTGILPVLPTPFHADGSVDIEAMPALINFCIHAGVGGVVFPGFASEVEHLDAVERQSMLAQVVNTVDGAVPVVAGGSAATASAVVAYGSSAQALGTDWLMIQPPLLIGSATDQVIAFFSEITSKLPDIRIILQNAPAPRGSDLTPASLLEIVTAIPQIAYIKEETLPAGPAISTLLAARPDSLLGVIGGGGARYILDEYERGACAAMPAAEISDLHVKMDNAWRSGDKVSARDLYVRTLPLLTLQAVFRMRLTKHTLMRRGILHNAEVRAPTPDLDQFTTADIDANLVELQLIPESNDETGSTA